MATLDAVLRGVDRYVERAPAEIHPVAAKLIADTYQEMIDTSPVRTGSYRASHTLMRGDYSPEQLIYDAPNRPDPQSPPKSGEVLAAPSSADAYAVLAGLQEFGVTWIANPIHYALSVEYVHGYLIYEHARLLAEQLASALAVRGRRA